MTEIPMQSHLSSKLSSRYIGTILWYGLRTFPYTFPYIHSNKGKPFEAVLFLCNSIEASRIEICPKSLYTSITIYTHAGHLLSTQQQNIFTNFAEVAYFLEWLKVVPLKVVKFDRLHVGVSSSNRLWLTRNLNQIRFDCTFLIQNSSFASALSLLPSAQVLSVSVVFSLD